VYPIKNIGTLRELVLWRAVPLRLRRLCIGQRVSVYSGSAESHAALPQWDGLWIDQPWANALGERLAHARLALLVRCRAGRRGIEAVYQFLTRVNKRAGCYDPDWM
jgi:hypothetical protein